MALVFAAATQKELAAALSGVPELAGAAPEPGREKRRTVGGREVVVTTTGVGPVNAALAAGRILSAYDVEGVVLVGVAGTFDVGRAPIGSLAAATSEIFPEFGLRAPQGVDPRGIGFSQGESHPGREVWDVVELDPWEAAARMDLALPDCAAGPSVTVAGVTNCGIVVSDLAARYAPLTENMEGFPWALAAARSDTPFLELRAVSNMVASRTGWNLPAALKTLAGAVRGLIRPGRELAKGR